MAQARKAQRKLSKQTIQDEFPIKTADLLEAFLDPSEVLDGDRWSFVCNGDDELMIVRRRTTTESFDQPEEATQPLALTDGVLQDDLVLRTP